MSRVLGLNHVGVSVGDLARAEDLWCGLLGFEKFGGFAWDVGSLASDTSLDVTGTAAQVSLLRAGNAHIELFAFSAPAPRPRPEPLAHAGIGHLAVVAESVDDVAARAARHGAEVLAPPAERSGAVRSAWLAGPDGTRIEVLEARANGPYGLDGLALEPHPPADQVLAAPGRRAVRGLHHVGLGAERMEDAARFWAAIAGRAASSVADIPAIEAWRPGAALMVPLGNVRIEVVPALGTGGLPATDLGINHVCLDVDGIDDLARRGAELGVRWHHEPLETSGGKAAVAYGREPGGVVVELLECRSPEAFLWCGNLPGLGN